MAYIFDSNIIIGILNDNAEVISKASSYTDYCITGITAGELFYGAEKSKNKPENTKIIDQLISVTKVLSINKHVAKEYGKIKLFLKENGTPIPENDIWIAAISKAYNYPLITNDKHFKHLDNIITLVDIYA